MNIDPHKNITDLLSRFKETTEDEGTYDIGKENAAALATLGYLKRNDKHRHFYEMTAQGIAALEAIDGN